MAVDETGAHRSHTTARGRHDRRFASEWAAVRAGVLRAHVLVCLGSPDAVDEAFPGAALQVQPAARVGVSGADTGSRVPCCAATDLHGNFRRKSRTGVDALLLPCRRPLVRLETRQWSATANWPTACAAGRHCAPYRRLRHRDEDLWKRAIS